MTAGGARNDEREPRWDPRSGAGAGQAPPRAPQAHGGPGSRPPGPTAMAPERGNVAWLGPGSVSPPGPWMGPALSSPPNGPDGELSSARLLRPVRAVPRSGWRMLVYAATGGLVNPGESRADTMRRELGDRVNQRLTGCYRLAAVSVKGGVGKTSVLAMLGSTLASLRGDRVVAMDANPDRGNLVEKLERETSATVRTLLNDTEKIRTAADIRAYTSQSSARLEVLASESDPEMSEAFSAADYETSSALLARHYSILLTDCGTGIIAAALQAAVDSADSLLIVTTPSIDGARAAQATVEWLEAHGYRELIARSVTVINGVRRSRGTVDLDAVERFFTAHTRQVVRVPYDPHIDEGGEIHLDRLARQTRDALLHLAAVVADDFPRRAGVPTGPPARPELAPAPAVGTGPGGPDSPAAVRPS